MNISIYDLDELDKIDMQEIINELLEITGHFADDYLIEDALLRRGIEQHIIDILKDEGDET